MIDGTAPFTYSWTLAGAEVGTDLDLIDVLEGTYDLEVTDANGCIAMASATITDQPGPDVSGGTANPSSCGNADGSIIDVNVSGGTLPYEYSWTDAGGGTVGSLADLTGVPSGTYDLLVPDN